MLREPAKQARGELWDWKTVITDVLAKVLRPALWEKEKELCTFLPWFYDLAFCVS